MFADMCFQSLQLIWRPGLIIQKCLSFSQICNCMMYFPPANSKYFGQSEIDPYETEAGLNNSLQMLGKYAKKGEIEDKPQED